MGKKKKGGPRRAPARHAPRPLPPSPKPSPLPPGLHMYDNTFIRVDTVVKAPASMNIYAGRNYFQDVRTVFDQSEAQVTEELLSKIESHLGALADNDRLRIEAQIKKARGSAVNVIKLEAMKVIYDVAIAISATQIATDIMLALARHHGGG